MTCAAVFEQQRVLRISGGSNESWYNVIQTAYGVASDGDELKTLDSNFSEDLDFNRDISITFLGGWDQEYSSDTGRTTLIGKLTISNGSVNIKNLTII